LKQAAVAPPYQISSCNKNGNSRNMMKIFNR